MNLKSFISPIALALLRREEVEGLVEKALEDIEDPGKHYYWQM